MPQTSSSPRTAPETPRLLVRVRDKIRLKHYSIRTEQAYTDWVRRFVLFHEKRHPAEMGAAEVEKFLTHLAVEGNVAASTQNQAKSVLLLGQLVTSIAEDGSGITDARDVLLSRTCGAG